VTYTGNESALGNSTKTRIHDQYYGNQMDDPIAVNEFVLGDQGHCHSGSNRARQTGHAEPGGRKRHDQRELLLRVMARSLGSVQYRP